MRQITHSIVFITAILLLVCAVTSSAQKISLREVTDRIDVIHVDGKDDGVNIVVVQGRFSLTVFNTAWHPLTTQIIRNMIFDTYDNLPIEYVVDQSAAEHNSAGNQVFNEAIIIAHENTSAHLRDRAAMRKEKLDSLRNELEKLPESETARQAELKKEIAETEFAEVKLPTRSALTDFEIPLPGAAIQLRYFPGAATDGDFIALVPSERTLIAGDVIRNRAVPHWYPELGGSFRGLLNATESLFAFDRQYKHVIPGRGPAGGFEIIRSQHSYLLALLQRVTTARAEGKTLEQAKQEIRIDVYSDWAGYERLFPIQVEQLWNELEEQRPSTPRPQS